MNKDFFKDFFKSIKSSSTSIETDHCIGFTVPRPTYILLVTDHNKKEVFRVDESGRIFWRGREVETDSEFRNSMMGLKNSLDGMFTLEVK